MSELKLGIIGTDTSHAIAFTEIINDINHPYHVTGGKVIAAYPGGSPDFLLSITRVEEYMDHLRGKYSVQRLESPEEVAASCDAILLESADGRVHLEQLQRIASFGRPVFIDKPLALSYKVAIEIQEVATLYAIPIMSSSALRYADDLVENLAYHGRTGITGAEVAGPLNVEPTQSYYYWYGIHAAEMLYTIMGPGCVEVSVTVNEDHDLLTGQWKDGRIGTARCNRNGNNQFSAVIRRGHDISLVDIQSAVKPFYASLVEQIMAFFNSGQSPIAWQETLEIIRFLEAAEQSRQQGTIIRL
jgi:hypothetical protein